MNLDGVKTDRVWPGVELLLEDWETDNRFVHGSEVDSRFIHMHVF